MKKHMRTTANIFNNKIIIFINKIFIKIILQKYNSYIYYNGTETNYENRTDFSFRISFSIFNISIH
uniref:Uncharacterized protein n=1 Tax=viral metagenome TaxID=1070528 RepID=A0A6C0IV50_9ZZZZ